MIILAPFFVGAKGLVPDCNVGALDSNKTGYLNPCNFDNLLGIVNNVINFVLKDLATPLFALIIIYAGWLFLSDRGSASNVTKAKTVLTNALFGYVIALAAWLIVHTILTGLGFTGPNYLG